MKNSNKTAYWLFGISLFPVVAAYGLYFLTEWRPIDTKNFGILLDQPVSLTISNFNESNTLKNKWKLGYLTQEQCDQACMQKKQEMNQIRASLGKDQERLHTFIIINQSKVSSETPKFSSTYDEKNNQLLFNYNLSDLYLNKNNDKQESPLFYVIDPNNNLVMYYTQSHSTNQILMDLKHLLRISNIG